MRISDWSSDVCSSDLHAVRRLARFGEDKLLDHIVALAKADSPSPFLTRGFPLYFHFARQQLLIALARSADEAPASILPHVPFLRTIARPGHRHAFERMHAARALIALRDRKSTRLNSSPSCASRMPS